MRSKLVICAALAGSCLFGAWSPVVRAESKGKSAKGSKAKASDGLTDDKTISKQMQWEDSVMGPDDKRAELDKIARAQAINKAAQEKAARDKEKADAAAAREAASPKPQTAKRGGDVAIPSVPDEAPKKVETAEAPPPKPVKHGDDKFIDKLLKDEPGSKKRTSVDDKALDDLLAVGKPAPAAKPKRKDDVDSLLQSADKAPPMPETHAKKELQEWEKPEIQSAPQPTPVVLRTQPKRNDGVIRVVQGAATPARNVTPPASAVATRAPATNRRAAAADGSWNDPFAEGPKKTVAARDTRHSSDFDDDFTAAPRRRPAPAAATRPSSRNDFDDPPKEAPKATGGSRRAAPAAKPANKWKDPFTENRPSPKAAHKKVAARSAKAPRVQLAAAETGSAWGGVLKKHR
ncbi:MAG: hypothetical protein ACJ8F1_03055 [Polyangia bacterium]